MNTKRRTTSDSTGRPSCNAGSNVHDRTETTTASCSRREASPPITEAATTRPSAPILRRTITTPSSPADLAARGYIGAGVSRPAAPRERPPLPDAALAGPDPLGTSVRGEGSGPADGGGDGTTAVGLATTTSSASTAGSTTTSGRNRTAPTKGAKRAVVAATSAGVINAAPDGMRVGACDLAGRSLERRTGERSAVAVFVERSRRRTSESEAVAIAAVATQAAFRPWGPMRGP